MSSACIFKGLTSNKHESKKEKMCRAVTRTPC